MNPVSPLSNECSTVQASFSGYLDGAITGREMQAVAAHLELCSDCHAEFAAWRGMQRLLAETGVAKAPADLGLQLRLAISHENSKIQGRRHAAMMRWENFLRPMMVQAASGLAGTLLLVGGLAMLIGVVAAPTSVLANDEPLGAVTKAHYLYSVTDQQPVATPNDATVVVEAEVNAEGRVCDWHIVSGEVDQRTRSAVEQHLMLEVYEPARVFGEAVRGRVLVTFSGVMVRG